MLGTLDFLPLYYFVYVDLEIIRAFSGLREMAQLLSSHTRVDTHTRIERRHEEVGKVSFHIAARDNHGYLWLTCLKLSRPPSSGFHFLRCYVFVVLKIFNGTLQK